MLRRHPVLASAFAGAIVGGALLGVLYLSPDWSLGRRLAAGAVAGAGIVLLVAGPKLFVS